MSEKALSTTEDPGLKPVPATEQEWMEVLGPDQYRVLRQAGRISRCISTRKYSGS